MTVVFLIRHAAHAELGRSLTGRKAGVALSESGARQALALGERLIREPISKIYSSPRLRARATAEAIGDRLGLPVEVDQDLDEIDFGKWTGASFEELACDPSWRQWNEARATASPPDGESMAEAAARIVRGIGRICGQHRNSAAVALVSHCDMIRGAVAHYLGLSLNNLLRFDIDPASITRLEVGAWGGRVAALNETTGI